MEKLPQAEVALGPEMRSTGEVMGFGEDADTALRAALVGAGWHLPERTLLVSLADRDKAKAVPLLREFAAVGFHLVATPKTADVLQRAGVEADAVAFDQLRDLDVGWVLNTPTRGGDPSRRGFQLRRRALEQRIPCITSLDTASALLHALLGADTREPMVQPLPESAWG
jgi:carbamoyl-phosphate synthase large subunit